MILWPLMGLIHCELTSPFLVEILIDLLVMQGLFSSRYNYNRNAESTVLIPSDAGNSLLPQSVFQHFICMTYQIPFSRRGEE